MFLIGFDLFLVRNQPPKLPSLKNSWPILLDNFWLFGFNLKFSNFGLIPILYFREKKFNKNVFAKRVLIFFFKIEIIAFSFLNQEFVGVKDSICVGWHLSNGSLTQKWQAF